MLLRPSDLLWLGYRFSEVMLQGDDTAVPNLVPAAGASAKPAMMVTLAPQNIAERAYFEHVAKRPIPKSDPPQPDINTTPAETPDEPPVASRAAAESRLAFTLPANVHT